MDGKICSGEGSSPGLRSKKRAHTLGNTLRHALLIAISFVAILMILGELGIQLGPLLATAGIGALAIGFGAQSLVKDVISGFFIILENQYRIGDAIEVGGVSGLVESVSLRKTVLRDLDGKVHTIPNGEIKIVSNLSKEWSRSVLDVGISYREDVDQVIDLLSQIGKELEAEEPYKSAILGPLTDPGDREIWRIPAGHPYDDKDRPIETVGDREGVAEKDQESI